MFKMLVFKNDGSVRTLEFKNETRKVVLAKYRQLLSQGDIAEYIVMNPDGSPNLSGSY